MWKESKEHKRQLRQTRSRNILEENKEENINWGRRLIQRESKRKQRINRTTEKQDHVERKQRKLRRKYEQETEINTESTQRKLTIDKTGEKQEYIEGKQIQKYEQDQEINRK